MNELPDLSDRERLAVEIALSFLARSMVPCEVTKMWYQPHRSTFVCTPDLMVDLRSALGKLEPWRKP